MTYQFDVDYELVRLGEDGTAFLRNVKTGQELKGRVVVNLNDGCLRIAIPIKPRPDKSATS